MRDPVDELQILESAGLRRRLRRLESPQGITINLARHGTCLNFSSNDYLGLADNEELKIAYLEHIGRYGGGGFRDD